MSPEIFVGLADQKLMLTFPDIINLPYIHIDHGALLCYHFLLAQGSLLDKDTPLDESLRYSRRVYIHCLEIIPLWQKEASATQMDFVASVLMVRTQCRLQNAPFFAA